MNCKKIKNKLFFHSDSRLSRRCGHNVPPHSSHIQKPRTIRVKWDRRACCILRQDKTPFSFISLTWLYNVTFWIDGFKFNSGAAAGDDLCPFFLKNPALISTSQSVVCLLQKLFEYWICRRDDLKQNSINSFATLFLYYEL